eukprot:3239542-Pleurochrysis_carterae.AAC.1
MSCDDNPEANMASNEGTGTPADARQSLKLSELAGELSLLAHAAAAGGDYDADRMDVLTDALRTIGRGGEESDAARNLQETQRTAKLNAPCTRRPIASPAVRRNLRPATSSEPAKFGTWPGKEAAAAPTTAVHAEMGVRVRYHHVPSRQYPSRCTQKRLVLYNTTCYKRDNCNTKWYRVAIVRVPASKAMTNIRSSFKVADMFPTHQRLHSEA